MATRRNLERWQSWRDVIRRQAERGLSVAAFCREQQVPPASFFAWRKKLAEADQNANAAPGRDADASHEVWAQFVPIAISPLPPSSANFEIVGPDGYGLQNDRLIAVFETAAGQWALGGTNLPFGDKLQERFSGCPRV